MPKRRIMQGVSGACIDVARDQANPPQVVLPSEGYARQPQVLSVIPFGRSTLWQKVKTGEFPAPVKLSERVTAWRVADVRKWIAERDVQATS